MKGLQAKEKNQTKEVRQMKVKFRFGIKSYSGTLDELNYANYEDRSVVIGRMLPTNREMTAQNENLGSKSSKISDFYLGTSDGYKADLKAYAKKMYNLKAYKNKLAGSGYTAFIKMMWAASQIVTNPIDIDSLSIDDLSMGSYNDISSVKTAIDKGFLPKVDGYEDYTNSIGA